MSVVVPTADEFDALQQRVAALDARVLALEETATTPPPDPPDNPDAFPTLPIVIPPDVPPPNVEPPPAGTLQVVVQLAGAQYVFNEADGRDLGAYRDPSGRFSERCTRTTHPDTPLRCDFRRMEGRTSVVFAQGFWQDAAPCNLPEYEATISGDELASPITQHCPSHSAWQRWRWCSAPWPLPMRRMEDLYAAKLLPRFDAALTHGHASNYGHVTYSPMGLAGLYAYMPTTGGRGDIGHLTNWQAQYAFNEGDQAWLADVLAQGEAAATYPWDFADRDTGAVIDAFEQYPTATLYSASAGSPFIQFASASAYVDATISGPPGTVLSPNGSPPSWSYLLDANRQQYRVPVDLTIGDDGTVSSTFEVLGNNEPAYGAGQVQDYWGNIMPDVTCDILDGTYIRGSGITIDSAHQPAMSYLPFLLTGDPYHLENLQRQVAFILMENPSAPVRSYDAIQPRACGWSARTLAQCAKVSPESPPSWLLPRRLYVAAINKWADDWFYNETCDNPANNRAVLHLVGASYGGAEIGGQDGTNTWSQPYQEDIAHGGLGWLALLHLDSQWPEIVRWNAEQTLARLDPASGWSLNVPTAYSIKVAPADGQPAYGSWAEAWEANAEYLGAYSDTLPTPGPGDIDYWGHMAAGMAIAHQAGCVDNAEPLGRLLEALGRALRGGGCEIEPQRCIAGPVS